MHYTATAHMDSKTNNNNNNGQPAVSSSFVRMDAEWQARPDHGRDATMQAREEAIWYEWNENQLNLKKKNIIIVKTVASD